MRTARVGGGGGPLSPLLTGVAPCQRGGQWPAGRPAAGSLAVVRSPPLSPRHRRGGGSMKLQVP